MNNFVGLEHLSDRNYHNTFLESRQGMGQSNSPSVCIQNSLHSFPDAVPPLWLEDFIFQKLHTYIWACNSLPYFEFNISLLAVITQSTLLTLYFTKEQVLTKIKKFAKRFKKINYTTSALILLFIFSASIKQHLYISFLLPYVLHFYVTYKTKQSSEPQIRDGFGFFLLFCFFLLSSGCTFTVFQVGVRQVFLHKLIS